MTTTRTASALSPLTAAVRRLYEAHPYPRYPLLATPRWQDGYASTALFAAALYKNESSRASQFSSTLVAGCGEIFPYVMRRWQPRTTKVTCLDLSQQSLRRARLRLALTFKSTRFEHADLDQYLATEAQMFDHIDAYGVIHHLPDPGRTLKLMAARLQADGTVRLMVYNTPARAWIHSVQRLLALFAFDATRPGDIEAARRLLQALATTLPALAHRLGQLGDATLANAARFADTFLHPREARLAVPLWFERIAAAELKPVGLFDRYGELDDLPNPLWHVPSVQALAERAADARYENNLELFLKGAGSRGKEVLRDAQDDGAAYRHPERREGPPFLMQFKQPPSSWFRYRETADLHTSTRWRLWRSFLAAVSGRPTVMTQRELLSLSTATLQRLARIGAILPTQLPAAMHASASAPMCGTMDLPVAAPSATANHAEWTTILRAVMTERGLTGERRLQSALRRLATIG